MRTLDLCGLAAICLAFVIFSEHCQLVPKDMEQRMAERMEKFE